MSADSTTASLFPEALIKAIKEKRLVPFVGAGVSMSVRRADGTAVFPSWEGLLEGMAERLEREKQPQAALIKAHLSQPVPDLLEAARCARRGLGGQWVKVLQETFEPKLSGLPAEAFTLPRAVWGLSANLVVTTNYDKVLQNAATYPIDVRTVGISPPQVAGLSAGADVPTVWHLHGHIGEPHQMVLTPDSYNTLYPDALGTAETATQHNGALAVLQSMLGSWTFLFVGFSMTDAAFVRQLEWLRDTFPGANGPHYVLVKKSETRPLLAMLQAKDLDVRAVVFEDFGAPMVQVLRELATDAGIGIEPLPPPVDDSQNLVNRLLCVLQRSNELQLAVATALNLPKSSTASELARALMVLTPLDAAIQLGDASLALEDLGDTTGLAACRTLLGMLLPFVLPEPDAQIFGGDKPIAGVRALAMTTTTIAEIAMARADGRDARFVLIDEDRYPAGVRAILADRFVTAHVASPDASGLETARTVRKNLSDRFRLSTTKDTELVAALKHAEIRRASGEAGAYYLLFESKHAGWWAVDRTAFVGELPGLRIVQLCDDGNETREIAEYQISAAVDDALRGKNRKNN